MISTLTGTYWVHSKSKQTVGQQEKSLYLYLCETKIKCLNSRQTCFSLDSVKPTKVESSLVSPAVIKKSAVSTAIHEEGLSEEQNTYLKKRLTLVFIIYNNIYTSWLLKKKDYTLTCYEILQFFVVYFFL